MAIRKSIFFSKKGFFFTFLAILIVSILLITFIKIPAQQSQKQAETVKIKINLINDFTSTMRNSYIPRILYFASKNVLINFINENDITKFKDPSDSSKSIFEAKFAEELSVILNPLLIEISKISKEKLQIESSIVINTFTISQKDAWTIEVKARYSITISNIEKDIRFEVVDNEVVILIPIDGFDDPLFRRKANLHTDTVNEQTRIIKKTAILEWSNTNTISFYKQKLYRESTDASSFLDRIKGDYTLSSLYGIETLLNPTVFIKYSNGYSFVDYKLLTKTAECKSMPDGTKTSDLYKIVINGIDNDFYLDIGHIGKYNLTEFIVAPFGCP